MKISILFVLAVFSVCGVSMAAQEASAAAQQNATASAAGGTLSQSADAQAKAGRGSVEATGSEKTSGEMRPVKGELVGKLDSKSAKAGDQVVVKTQEKTRTAEGLEIPKGSRLVGHVTDVEAHGSGHADSSISIAFDRAELKGGQNVAIHSVIESMDAPQAAAALASDDAMGAPIGGGGRVAGGGRAGGGLIGGAVGSTNSAAGNLGSNLNSSTTGALRSTSAVAGDATAGVGGGLRATADGTGSLAAHATGVPGVMLAGSASGATSGTLTASRKNVHLDSGTQVVLGVSGSASVR